MAGGGVGEAMLIGAAVGATAGGAGAAIQGGDPLQGALVGGATGAIGGGIGGALTPAATVVPGATTGATTGATAGGTAGATAGTTAGATGSTFGSLAAPTGTAIGSGMGSGASGFGSIAAPTGATVGSGMGSGASSLGIAAPTGVGAGGASSLGIAQGSALPAGGFSATGTMPVNAPPGNFTGYAPQLSNKALGLTAAGGFLGGAMGAERDVYGTPPDEKYDGPLNKLRYNPDKFKASEPIYAPGSVYRPTYAAEGGIMNAYKAGGIASYAPGGMVDPTIGMAAQQQSNQPSTGSQGIDALMGKKKRMLTKEQMDAVNMQGMSKGAMQDVYGQMAAQGLAKGGSAGNKDMAAVDAYVAAAQGGDMGSVMAKAQAGDYNAMIALNKVRKTPNQNYAAGGHLGGYSDGGRMLKGPGDGMSDNIPATIAGKQPARLADGEFVVPADVVSHLGNGSTDAGAKQLYAMMNRVRKARTGNQKQGKQIKPAKYMAA